MSARRSARRRPSWEDAAGFTLIELLVVIVIIAILAALAIPVFLGQREKAYDGQAKSDLRNVASHEESYYTDTGRYSTSVTTGCVISTTQVCYQRSSNTSPISAVYVDATGVPTTTSTISGYCLWTTSDSGQVWYYNSARGGLQSPAATAC